MKAKIKQWIFTKCLQIAARIEPYRFSRCLIDVRFEADMACIVPPDGKYHTYAFTFSASIKKPSAEQTDAKMETAVYIDGVSIKECGKIYTI
jgi:hypothetical protein